MDQRLKCQLRAAIGTLAASNTMKKKRGQRRLRSSFKVVVAIGTRPSWQRCLAMVLAARSRQNCSVACCLIFHKRLHLLSRLLPVENGTTRAIFAWFIVWFHCLIACWVSDSLSLFFFLCGVELYSLDLPLDFRSSTTVMQKSSSHSTFFNGSFSANVSLPLRFKRPCRRRVSTWSYSSPRFLWHLL